MTVTEYNKIYSQRLQFLVEEHVAKKYRADEPIVCYFAPYYVYTDEETAHCFEPELVQLSKEDYTTLLFTIIKHHNMTFEELPLYISPELYRHIIESFSFIHVVELNDHPCALEEETYPMAVSMTTLMEDAKEIIGEEMMMTCMQSCESYKEYDSASVCIDIWMGIMEVFIECEKVGDFQQGIDTITHKDIYGMIDASAVLSALKVEKCKEVSNALQRLFKELAAEDESDITWFIRWLEAHGIKYIHAEGSFKREYSRYRYKSKERTWKLLY